MEVTRTKGSPAQERSICPNCGRKGLGNTYSARFADGVFAYRQCRYCSDLVRLGVGSLPEPRDNFPKNKVERAVYEHYLTGCERGDLFRYVKLGKAGLAGPDRSHSAAYAAWRAGKTLAE